MSSAGFFYTWDFDFVVDVFFGLIFVRFHSVGVDFDKDLVNDGGNGIQDRFRQKAQDVADGNVLFPCLFALFDGFLFVFRGSKTRGVPQEFHKFGRWFRHRAMAQF